MDLKDFIRDVPDFPKPGIVFKDITPILQDANALRLSITKIANAADDWEVTKVAGIESRGFIFGTPVAMELGVGFVPVRKLGKLPWETIGIEYDLEYGSDHVEMHVDSVGPGDRVLIVDDLLATGGTLAATMQLIEKSGAEVAGAVILIELAFLGGRKLCGNNRIESLLRFD